jgi:hypothetical protein
MHNAFQFKTVKVFVLVFSIICISKIAGAKPDTLSLKLALNTPVAISGLSFAAVGNFAFIQYQNSDSVYRLIVNDAGITQMQHTVALPVARNSIFSQVQKQIEEPALLQNSVFNSLGSIIDGDSYTKFYTNKAYNSFFLKK